MGDMNAPLLPPRRRHQSPAENPAVGAVLLLEKAAALATALPPASAMPHWPWVCEAGAVPQFGREQAAAAMAADPFKASYVAEMDAELLKHTAGKPRKMRAFYRPGLWTRHDGVIAMTERGQTTCVPLVVEINPEPDGFQLSRTAFDDNAVLAVVNGPLGTARQRNIIAAAGEMARVMVDGDDADNEPDFLLAAAARHVAAQEAAQKAGGAGSAGSA